MHIQIREVDGKRSTLSLSEGKALVNSVLGARTEKQSNKIFKVFSLSYFMPKSYNLCHLLGEGSWGTGLTVKTGFIKALDKELWALTKGYPPVPPVSAGVKDDQWFVPAGKIKREGAFTSAHICVQAHFRFVSKVHPCTIMSLEVQNIKLNYYCKGNEISR